MMGGADAVIEHARKLLVTGSLHDAQAAAELLDLVLAIEPSNGAAEAHKARAIEALGHGATNQNARGYLLSSALEMQGKIAPPIKPTVTPSTIRELPIDVILLSLPERLDPVRSRKAVMTVGFEFFDTKRHFYFAVRNGVAEVREQTAIDADLIVRASEADFKNFLLDARPLSRLVALVRGKVSLSGGWGFLHNLVKFQRFGSLITPP
jgi:alkyl sulfatase BDS1-like metallo-beta-lactamase superfamily hydrolase